MRIILPKKKYVKALNTDNIINIELQGNTKLLSNMDINEIVDQHQVFEEERANCTKYRLVLTINPYNTNVLGNPLTIIPSLHPINDKVRIKEYIANLYSIGYYNKSKEKNDITYLKGYNIFDNFLFRSDTFRYVEEMDSTVGDNHVYDMSSTWSIADAFENGLKQDDKGWVGFINPVKLKTDKNENISSFIEETSPCGMIDVFPTREWFSFNGLFDKENLKTLNNWDYVITYPFENETENVLVKNGIPILTIDIDEENQSNLLRIRTAYKNNLKVGDRFTLINDKLNNLARKYKEFTVYKLGDDEEEENTFYVSTYSSLLNEENELIDGLNLTKDNVENGFVSYLKKTTNGVESKYYIRKFKKLVNLKYEEEEVTYNNIKEKENLVINKEYDFANSLYNLAFAKTVYGDDISQITFTDDINIKYLKDNLGRPLSEFYVTIVKNNENTIYKDSNNEPLKVFGKNSSGIKLTSLTEKDTILAKSDFFNENYRHINYIHNLTNTNDKIIEEDLDDDKSVLKQIKIKSLNLYSESPRKLDGFINEETDESYSDDISNPLIFTKSPKHLEEDIKINKDFFYSDIIEFNPLTFTETILEDVYHRFNTIQRESFEKTDRFMFFHEILSDDFDYSKKEKSDYENEVDKDSDFLKPYLPKSNSGEYISPIQPNGKWEYSNKKGDSCNEGENTELPFIYRGKVIVGPRPEGYYYKPHYPINLKLWSENVEFRTYRQYNVTDYGIEEQQNGYNKKTKYIYFILEFTHGMKYGDIIRIKYKDNNIVFDQTNVVYTTEEDGYKLKFLYDEELGEIIKTNPDNSNFKISEYGFDIPDYASDLGDGRYVWRNLLNDGDNEDMNNINNEHVFTNGSFYIHNSINFFLRRQDPFGDNGLLYKRFPSDLSGEIIEIDNVTYTASTQC
ncbi:MAG: hypothetical protein M0R03_08950 [Novosphingobium sp.]|nr:hypothetical protein [Novosphingobium sp.]